MQFDHVKGKKIGISRAVNYGYSINNIMKEISKCEIVCANCHAIRTFTRRFSVNDSTRLS
jgi:hypothetical protein